MSLGRHFWLIIVSSTILQGAAAPAMSQGNPAYVGRWLTDSAAECKRERRHPEGAIVYTAQYLRKARPGGP